MENLVQIPFPRGVRGFYQSITRPWAFAAQYALITTGNEEHISFHVDLR